jgi:hypothetical protein
MISKKLVRYICASLTKNENVQAEQFEEIQESVKTFAQTVDVLVKDRNFAGLKTVMLDFIEQQDGVGYDEDGGGTGLLGDTEVLEAAARYLLRREKDSKMAAMLMAIFYQKAQGTPFPSTTKYVRLSELL